MTKKIWIFIVILIAFAVISVVQEQKQEDDSLGSSSGTREWVFNRSSGLVRSLTNTQGTLISNSGSTATTSAVTLEVIGDSLFDAATSTNFAVTGLTAVRCVESGTGGHLLSAAAACGTGGGAAWEAFGGDINVLTSTTTGAAILVNNSSSTISTLRVPDNLFATTTLIDTLTLTNALTVANGGTGISTCTDGGIILGSGTGPFTCLAVATNGQIPIGDGTTDPVLNEIDGTANEITVTNGAGTITLSIPDAVTLVTLTLTNDLTVVNGGTGAGTFTDGGVLLGSGTSPITAMAVLGNGAIIVGDGTTDPVALTAFTSSIGTLRHEQGGLEFDASGITTGGLVRGASAGVMSILAVGTDGQVLTAQADSSVAWEDAAGGAANLIATSTDQLGAALTITSPFVTSSSTSSFYFPLDLQVDGVAGIASSSPFAILSVENTGSGLSFAVNDEASDASPFVIAADGNVGIGTTVPSSTIHLVGTGDSLTFDRYTNSASPVTSLFRKSRGTVSSPLVVAAGDRVSNMVSQAYDGSTFDTVSSIRVTARSVSGANVSGELDIRLNDTSGDLQTRMIILEDGNVGISSTTPFALLSVEQTGSGLAFAVNDVANDATPFVIDASGNVGINTAAPGFVFDVNDSAGNTLFTVEDGGTVGNATTTGVHVFGSDTDTSTSTVIIGNPEGTRGGCLEFESVDASHTTIRVYYNGTTRVEEAGTCR